MLTHTKVWNTLVQSFPPSMSCTAALPGSIAQSVQSPQASVSSIQAPHPGLGAYVFPTRAHHPVRPAPSPLDLVKEPLYHLHVLHHEHPSEQGPWAARVHIPSAPRAQVEGHRAQSSGATQWWGLEEEGGSAGKGPWQPQQRVAVLTEASGVWSPSTGGWWCVECCPSCPMVIPRTRTHSLS